ncbi:MAG TPA: hypothetical protein VHU84_09190 [Lacipirellulaceae bacterium]|jgi:hypothetical protein|nr:hypothetical protein [Lacipirellulaceae bacterium]
MLSDTDRSQIRAIVRTEQIIVGALAFGILNFTGVVMFMSIAEHRGAEVRPLISYTAAIFSFLALFAAFAVPMFLGGPLRTAALDPSASNNPNPAIRLANVYRSLLIIRCAILEGAAFFCLTSYIIERYPLSAVLANILLVVLLLQFPTASRVEERIESDLLVAEQLKHLQ